MKKIVCILSAFCLLVLTGCGETVEESVIVSTDESSIAKVLVVNNEAETLQVTNPINQEDLIETFLFYDGLAQIAGDFRNDLSYTCNAYNYETGKITSTIPKEFTLNELITAVIESPNLMDVSPNVSYYMTISSGVVPILLIYFEGLNIDGPGDDSFAIFAFSQIDDKLLLNFADDSWARNRLEVYQDLSFEAAGSNGAGDSSLLRMRLDENGKYKLVYDARYLYADWIAMNLLDEYDAVFDEYDEMVIINTPEDEYYDCPNLVGNEEKYSQVINVLKKRGAKQISDSASFLMDIVREEGLDEEPKEITSWTTILAR